MAEDNNTPEGGIHLAMGFGQARAATPPALQRPTFRILVIGDLGGAGDGHIEPLTTDTIAELPGRFGVHVRAAIGNRLGTQPPALALDLPIRHIHDLKPASILGAVPELAEAEAFLLARSKGRPVETEGQRFDKLEALAPRIRPASAARAGSERDASVDRILSLIDDGSAGKAHPAAARAAGKGADLPSAGPLDTGRELLDRQRADVLACSGLTAIASAWQGLRLLLSLIGRTDGVTIEICDVSRERIAEILTGEVLTRELSDETKEIPLGAVLVLGWLNRSSPDLALLGDIAEAAETLQVPAIVSLAADFIHGTNPGDIGTLDDPGSLLDGAGYEVFRSLRTKEPARWVAAAWNDVLLRPEADGAPALWGCPGLVLAAVIARSIGRMGWPSRMTGPDCAVTGLEIATAGRVAIPLRYFMQNAAVSSLADAGITALVCHPDRDNAFLLAAQTLRQPQRLADDPRGVNARKRVSLSFQLTIAHVSRLLTDALPELTETARDREEAAGAIKQWLSNLLSGSGSGWHVDVSETRDRDDALDVSLRFGTDVLDGEAMAFTVPI